MTKAPNIKISLKTFILVSRISGLSKGLQGIKDMDEFNKEGVVNSLKEIEEMAETIRKEGEHHVAER